MKSVKSSLLILGMVGALSACAPKDVFLNNTYETDFGTYQDSDYVEDRLGRDNEQLKTTDWTTAKQINLKIRQNEFSPMIVHMRKDVPYVLTIENRDLSDMSFRAVEFFKNTSVAKLEAAQSGEDVFEAQENPDLISFIVPGMSKRSLQVIPVMEGRYDFEDGAPGITFIPRWHIAPYSRGATLGTAGVIIVE